MIASRMAIVTGALVLGLVPATASAGVTFKSPAGYDTGSNPLGTAVGDVNGDGYPDIVTADNGGGTATVLLGHADGTFTVHGSYPSAAPKMAAPGGIALGHFLGTGHLDAALIQIGPPYQVDLLPGAGNGSLGAIAASKPTPSQYTDQIATGVMTSLGKEGIVIGDAQKVDVFLANGNGTFTTEPQLSSPGFGSSSIAFADVNGDGIRDVITGGPGLWVFLGKGDGTFQAGHSVLSGAIEADHIAVGDFNGDGHADIASLNSTQNKIGILLGDGHGSFSASPSTQPTASGSQTIAVGDLDSNGKLDLVTTSRSGNVMSIFAGNGDGTLAARQDITVSGAWQPAIADLNGDGNPDIAVGSGTLNQMLVFLSTAPTATATPGSVTFGSQTVGSAAPIQAVTAQNTSSSSLPSIAPPHLSLSGANPGDFSVGGCSAPTAPGAGCQLTVGFDPTDVGARTATLTISDNAGTRTVALKGTGVAPSVPTTPTTPNTPTTPTTPAQPTSKPPTISKLAQAHRRWHETGRRRHRRVVGTSFSFTLDQAAKVHIVFRRRGRKPYARTIGFAGRAGPNRISFSGRLGRGKWLALGTYVVTITATNGSAHTSAAHTLRFTALA